MQKLKQSILLKVVEKTFYFSGVINILSSKIWKKQLLLHFKTIGYTENIYKMKFHAQNIVTIFLFNINYSLTQLQDI